MGTAIAYKDIDASEQKKQELKKRQRSVQDSILYMDTKEGTIATSSQTFTSISGTENKESLLNKISKILQASTKGGQNSPLQLIVNDLAGFLSMARTSTLYMQQSRVYPMVTQQGFTIGYLNFYLEKLPVKMDNSIQENIVMISAYKIIIPEPPQQKSELAGYVAASSVPQDKKDEILDSLWMLVLETKSTQALIEQKKKMQAIRKIQQLLNNKK